MENQELNKVFIGVDPGVKGFLTIHFNGVKEFIEMPKTGKNKDKLDTQELVKICIRLSIRFSDMEVIVGFEDVHALFGSSAKATFTFGHTVGQQYAALSILTLKSGRIELITPKKWQSLMWRGIEIVKVPSSTGKTFVNDTKATSLNAAKKLWPEEDWRRNSRCKVDDDNKVDSALVCEYLIKKFS